MLWGWAFPFLIKIRIIKLRAQIERDRMDLVMENHTLSSRTSVNRAWSWSLNLDILSNSIFHLKVVQIVVLLLLLSFFLFFLFFGPDRYSSSSGKLISLKFRQYKVFKWLPLKLKEKKLFFPPSEEFDANDQFTHSITLVLLYVYMYIYIYI